MKKSIIYSMLVGAALLVACDPIEDRDTMTGAITADQLKISAKPVVKDGVNSNYIELNSEGNPCLSSWDYGFGILANTKGTVKVMMAGDNEIVYSGMNPDGTIITKKITVHVDKLYDVEPEFALLCGDKGTKTWVWDDTMGTPWGNGGYKGNTSPGWWKCSVDDIETQAVGKGYLGDGKNGSMLFSLKGMKLTKSDGTTGSFSFDMSKKTTVADGSVWGIGKLYTKSVNVLLGIQPNQSNAIINEYDILKLDATHLYLACPESAAGDAGSGCWFWCFKAK
ncbi:hypothetical protein [uncultured Bacteroides sp.]|uniref:hypothetical protein n=1 Tax=uncultured Bacteroides sp. TaxID=162156 RepID=UPI002AAC1EB5|nr:hypothetical protein [uncultured Bacteroides sp.]